MADPTTRIRAAIDAIWTASPAPPTLDELIAAVLRAVVDEVTPLATNRRQNEIRAEILAIAAELEGTNA